jgi:hypothetical protein
MAGTTGLEPATSAVTGQRSDQLSYVPRLFFNNLDICHIESSVSQFSLFSLFSTISRLWTQFWASVDTTWTPNRVNATTKSSLSDEIKFGVHFAPLTEQNLRSQLGPLVGKPAALITQRSEEYLLANSS